MSDVTEDKGQDMNKVESDVTQEKDKEIEQVECDETEKKEVTEEEKMIDAKAKDLKKNNGNSRGKKRIVLFKPPSRSPIMTRQHRSQMIKRRVTRKKETYFFLSVSYRESFFQLRMRRKSY